MNKPYVTAAVLAAGLGSRMQSSVTKQKIELCGKSIVKRAVELFSSCDLVDDIIVVVKEDELEFSKTELSDIKKPLKLVIGGKFRAESAKNAFLALDAKTEFIAIHDAARCLTAICDIETVIKDAFKYGAATASREVFNTVKEIDSEEFILGTLNRSYLRFVETPQVFSVDIYKEALEASCELDASFTDDNMLIEKTGKRIYCSKMTSENLKITTPADISYAEFLLKRKLCDE